MTPLKTVQRQNIGRLYLTAQKLHSEHRQALTSLESDKLALEAAQQKVPWTEKLNVFTTGPKEAARDQAKLAVETTSVAASKLQTQLAQTREELVSSVYSATNDPRIPELENRRNRIQALFSPLRDIQDAVSDKESAMDGIRTAGSNATTAALLHKNEAGADNTVSNYLAATAATTLATSTIEAVGASSRIDGAVRAFNAAADKIPDLGLSLSASNVGGQLPSMFTQVNTALTEANNALHRYVDGLAVQLADEGSTAP